MPTIEKTGWTEQKDWDESVQSDAELTHWSSCEECGHNGLDFSYWWDGQFFHSLARCPECGHEFEW
jgi:hypothetical protein